MKAIMRNKSSFLESLEVLSGLKPKKKLRKPDTLMVTETREIRYSTGESYSISLRGVDQWINAGTASLAFSLACTPTAPIFCSVF